MHTTPEGNLLKILYLDSPNARGVQNESKVDRQSINRTLPKVWIGLSIAPMIEYQVVVKNKIVVLKRYPGLYIASKYKEYHNLLPSIRGEQSSLQTGPTNSNWTLLSKLGDTDLVKKLKSCRATGNYLSNINGPSKDTFTIPLGQPDLPESPLYDLDLPLYRLYNLGDSLSHKFESD
jgi:hypothetical protein